MKTETNAAVRCTGCGHDGLTRFLRIDDVPVVTTELWPTAGTARSAQRGDLDLAVCPMCGLIRNLAFDPARVEYTSSYESSQFFSPTFRKYAKQLAEHLIDRYALHGRVVVEVGSGKGEFLALLVELGVARALGYDPSYNGEVDELARNRIVFVREYYSEQHAQEPADLIVCRHVLEHVEDPIALLANLRRAIGSRSTPLYLEVPNAEFVLSAAGQWDLIYPHVSYFSARTLTFFLRRCGFDIDEVRTDFDGQFLCVEARPATEPEAIEPRAVGREIAAHAVAFGKEYEQTRRRWTQELGAQRAVGRRVALWGAGAKGVSFVNAVAGRGQVDAVVDVNERKQGGFLPGTAQRVDAPECLRESPPGTVLVMNALYETEIRSQLESLGIEADVVCV